MIELKPKQIEVVRLLASGASITMAAQNANVSRQSIYSWLNESDEFVACLNSLKKESLDAAMAGIQSAAVVAIETITSIMRFSENDAVRLNAAKEVLAMSGLTHDTAQMSYRGIGATVPAEVKAQKAKAAKDKAFMIMFDCFQGGRLMRMLVVMFINKAILRLLLELSAK